MTKPGIAARILIAASLTAVGCQEHRPADSAAAPAAPIKATASANPVGGAKAEATGPFAKPGFYTEEVKGVLWVYREGSKELEEFKAKGAPAKSVTRPAAGPRGMSVRSSDNETIVAYLVSKPGFHTVVKDERIFVVREGTKEHEEFKAKGAPAKSVTRPAAGPLSMSVRAYDIETINEYLAAKPGFVVKQVKETLWVIPESATKELDEFKTKGPPAKSVTRPGAGPGGISIRGFDGDHLKAYLVAKPGFITAIKDDRLWVIPAGSKESADFAAKGYPAKSVTRPSAGPMGMSVRAYEAEHIDLYLAAR